MSCSGWLDDRREYSTKMTRDASRSTLDGTGKLQFNRPGLDCSISSADLSAWNDFIRFLKEIPPRGFFFQSRHHCVCFTPCTALWRNPEHWSLICIELSVHFPESESRERFGMSKPRSELLARCVTVPSSKGRPRSCYSLCIWSQSLIREIASYLTFCCRDLHGCGPSL